MYCKQHRYYINERKHLSFRKLTHKKWEAYKAKKDLIYERKKTI